MPWNAAGQQTVCVTVASKTFPPTQTCPEGLTRALMDVLAEGRRESILVDAELVKLAQTVDLDWRVRKRS